MKNIAFTPQEKEIRKTWLALFWSLIGFNGGLPLVAFLVEVLAEPLTNQLILEAISIVWGFAGMAILYACAYKRPGNKFLTFVLIMTVFGLFRDVGNLAHLVENLWSLAFFLIGFALYVWWFVLSLKLRKINQRIRSLHPKGDTG